jgi:hypothetical protein
LQLKVAKDRRWGLGKKYRETKDLLIVFIWCVKQGADVPIYAMNYTEAEHLLSVGATDHRQSNSWKDKGAYHTVPSKDLLEALEPFRMTKDKWQARLARA